MLISDWVYQGEGVAVAGGRGGADKGPRQTDQSQQGHGVAQDHGHDQRPVQTLSVEERLQQVPTRPNHFSVKNETPSHL